MLVKHSTRIHSCCRSSAGVHQVCSLAPITLCHWLGRLALWLARASLLHYDLPHTCQIAHRVLLGSETWGALPDMCPVCFSHTSFAAPQELQEEFTRRLASADRTIASLKEKNDGLRTAAAAASKGGTANEARLQDRESYIASLQARPQTGLVCNYTSMSEEPCLPSCINCPTNLQIGAVVC